MSVTMNWKAYVDWLIVMNNLSPEKAVERANAKLMKEDGKGLSWKEQNEYLRQKYRVNPYRVRRDR